MTSETISRVGVVGARQMGAGIAEVCARADCDVLVYDTARDLLTQGRGRVQRSLDQAVSRGALTERGRERAARCLRFTSDLDEFADRGLVIEAIDEDERVKTEMFARLDAIVAPETILASNTSTVSISALAGATADPSRVIGMHFFHPVPVLPLMELIVTEASADRVVRAAREFAYDVLGKHVITSGDRSGFVVNALIVPYVLSAIRMVESGFSTVDDVDSAMVLGCSHPMGPLKLADAVGLDNVAAIAEQMHREFDEPLYSVPPLLARMVAAGRVGKKVGHGFYRYGDRVVADM